MKTLIAPSGKRIVGTAECMFCTASIEVRGRKPDGSLDWEHDGMQVKDYPETMETRLDPGGETLFTDEDGVDWPESMLKLADET